jgi:MFS family permease
VILMMLPEPRAGAGEAIGVYGFVAFAGGSIGLLLGGVLTEAISWHWIFLIIGIVTAYLAMRTRTLVLSAMRCWRSSSTARRRSPTR